MTQEEQDGAAEARAQGVQRVAALRPPTPPGWTSVAERDIDVCHAKRLQNEDGVDVVWGYECSASHAQVFALDDGARSARAGDRDAQTAIRVIRDALVERADSTVDWLQVSATTPAVGTLVLDGERAEVSAQVVPAGDLEGDFDRRSYVPLVSFAAESARLDELFAAADFADAGVLEVTVETRYFNSSRNSSEGRH